MVNKFIGEKEPVKECLRVTVIDANGIAQYNSLVEELTDCTIETPCPDGFMLPKWDGTQWIEGGTPPEPHIPEPTIEERLEAAEDALLTLISLGGL